MSELRELRDRFEHLVVYLRAAQRELNWQRQETSTDLLGGVLALVDGLIARAPFHEGDRVALRDTPTIQEWSRGNPFFAPGAGGRVHRIHYYGGHFVFAIDLDVDGAVYEEDGESEMRVFPKPTHRWLMVGEDDLQRWGL